MTPLEHAVRSSQKLSTKTKDLYIRRVQDFISFAGSDPADWTGYALECWRDHLLKQRGLKNKSVSLYMTAVAFAARRMANLGRGMNFAQAAERPNVKYAPSKTKPLTLPEVRRLVAACEGRRPPDLRDRAMILVALHTAFRRESMVSIEFEGCVDRTITALVKGGRMHSVRVNAEPWKPLTRWMNWLGRQGITSGRVFRSLRPSIEDADAWRIGESMSGNGFTAILNERAELAGLKHVHPHKLRHTYSSLARAAGVPEWRIQRVLGHRSPTMTGHYITDMSTEPVDAAFPSLVEDD